ncbi:hypothetical protein CDAR_256701 [Caerostris darwini]|uniref:Uncharacterized protein n=1 Tax=Caerostris darwini TaxID=1538125 RepID=A0AAV4PXE3_9ARAC|nr:hypothetical protein CDAR_256701 [Caerostris darwini]
MQSLQIIYNLVILLYAPEKILTLLTQIVEFNPYKSRYSNFYIFKNGLSRFAFRNQHVEIIGIDGEKGNTEHLSYEQNATLHLMDNTNFTTKPGQPLTSGISSNFRNLPLLPCDTRLKNFHDLSSTAYSAMGRKNFITPTRIMRHKRAAMAQRAVDYTK